MHQNIFQLELCPRVLTPLKQLTALPQPLAGIKRTYFQDNGRRVLGGEEGKEGERCPVCIFKYFLE